MGMKSKVLGVACAVTILGAGLVGITYADEIPEFAKSLKGRIHNCLSTIDFSEYENLTDSQKEQLDTLQTQLKEIMEEEKSVRTEMEEILEDAGIEIKNEKKERKELTEEERAELEEKRSLNEEKKAELKTNKELTKEKKPKMSEERNLVEKEN